MLLTPCPSIHIVVCPQARCALIEWHLREYEKGEFDPAQRQVATFQSFQKAINLHGLVKTPCHSQKTLLRHFSHPQEYSKLQSGLGFSYLLAPALL